MPATVRRAGVDEEGARSENVAMVPTAGPAIMPMRNDPAHHALARPRWWSGVTRTSRLAALTLNMIEPIPPRRATRALPVRLRQPASALETATTPMPVRA